MTILEAIVSECSYTLSEKTFLKKLKKRGLCGDAEATTEVLNSKAFELAEADIMIAQIPAISYSEGSMSVNAPNAEALRVLANGIYRKWGEPEVLAKGEIQPGVKYIDW